MDERISVLIVEDEKIILDDLLNMLDWEQEGFEVVATAPNGKLGLAAFQQFHPELVIADIQMPVMGGLSMLHQIREKNDAVSFLILSAYSEFEYAKEAVRLGTDSYLLKAEMSPELLRETLRPIREKIISRKSMHRFNSQHRFFALFSTCVEPRDNIRPSDQELTEAFTVYLSSAPKDVDCRNPLLWLIRECYAVLGLSSRETAPEFDSEADIVNWLLRVYHELCQLHEYIVIKKTSPTIINAVEYIKENYHRNDLQISTVAAHVGLSASRLSVLFKQELNNTVNDFITTIRMNEAKHMLRTGQYRVYEVAEAVGYKTSQYFSQLFFQHTGCSPTEYQKGGRE